MVEFTPKEPSLQEAEDFYKNHGLSIYEADELREEISRHLINFNNLVSSGKISMFEFRGIMNNKSMLGLFDHCYDQITENDNKEYGYGIIQSYNSPAVTYAYQFHAIFRLEEKHNIKFISELEDFNTRIR